MAWFDKLVASSATHADYNAGEYIPIFSGEGAGLYFRHSDHLGSTSVLSDSSGNRVEGSDVVYAPFGEVRIGEQTELTDFGFTGQRLDESTGGLMYYGARYYLPELRRFISADTIVPGAGNPQALNRYSYVFNNPINLIDPTGHRPPTEEEEQWWGMDEYGSNSISGSNSGGSSGSSGGSGSVNLWAPANSGMASDEAVRGSTGDNGSSHGNNGYSDEVEDLLDQLWGESSVDLTNEARLAAEQAFLHLLEDPLFFAEVLVNSSGVSEATRTEYADLEVFAYYSTLGVPLDRLVIAAVEAEYGYDVAQAIEDGEFLNWDPVPEGSGVEIILLASALFGANGVQHPSHTWWNRGPTRLDSENFLPGERPASLHVQDLRYPGSRWSWDPTTRSFEWMPGPIEANIRSDFQGFRNALNRALRALGATPVRER